MDEKKIEEVVRVVLSVMARETIGGYELPKARVVPFCRRIAEGIAECSDELLLGQGECGKCE